MVSKGGGPRKCKGPGICGRTRIHAITCGNGSGFKPLRILWSPRGPWQRHFHNALCNKQSFCLLRTELLKKALEGDWWWTQERLLCLFRLMPPTQRRLRDFSLTENRQTGLNSQTAELTLEGSGAVELAIKRCMPTSFSYKYITKSSIILWKPSTKNKATR